MNPPFFSIIIVSLNAESVIDTTLASTLAQSCGNFEIIVKDGGSTDGTLEHIPEDGRIRVHRESDRSVYDAMNQALSHANGEFLIFMNCGDTFATPEVLEKVKRFAEEGNQPEPEIIYGNYYKDATLFRQNSRVDRKYFLKEGFCHQSVFFRRTLFEKYGHYDINFRICADYEILIRCFVRGAVFRYIDLPVCRYQGGGISERQENLDRVRREGNRVRKRYFSRMECILYRVEKICRRLTRHLQ